MLNLRELCRDRMLRPRTESHRTAASSRCFEHIGDFRIHGQIHSQCEGAGEVRPSMLHLRSPRCSLRIAGKDQPSSVGVKDRKHRVEHIAHHLLEVIRALDGPVDPIHAFQKPQMGLAFLLRPLAFGDVHSGSDEFNCTAAPVLRQWLGLFRRPTLDWPLHSDQAGIGLVAMVRAQPERAPVSLSVCAASPAAPSMSARRR